MFCMVSEVLEEFSESIYVLCIKEKCATHEKAHERNVLYVVVGGKKFMAKERNFREL